MRPSRWYVPRLVFVGEGDGGRGEECEVLIGAPTALDAVARGVTLIATLHSRSERPTLAQLAAQVAVRVPGITCVQSARDMDPLRFA